MSYDPLTAVASRLHPAVHPAQLGLILRSLPQAKQSLAPQLSTFTPPTDIGPKVSIKRETHSVKLHRIIIAFRKKAHGAQHCRSRLPQWARDVAVGWAWSGSATARRATAIVILGSERAPWSGGDTKEGDTTAKDVYVRLRFDLGVRGFEIGFAFLVKDAEWDAFGDSVHFCIHRGCSVQVQVQASKYSSSRKEFF
jgi:hypothetical protein